MKIGITGAAGFIAPCLARELRSAGHETVGTDRNPGDEVRDQFDLLERGRFAEWVDEHQFDVVAHLAAQVSRVLAEDDLSRTVRWNAEVTTIVAQTLAERGVKLVYTSTSEVYGDHGLEPCPEDASWNLPPNLYGLSKRWGEEVARLYAPEGLVILRLSMPYGPGSPPGRGRRALDTMLWQAHHRMPITVHRDSERSWCWIGDTVNGIRLALENGHGAYNIGRDDDPRTMLEIAQRACKLANAEDSLITEVDPPSNLSPVKRLPTDRLRALGWAPTVEIDEGLERVYDWIKRYDANGVLS